jgi:hypothetical protein
MLDGKLELERLPGERRTRAEFESALARGVLGAGVVAPEVPVFDAGGGGPAFRTDADNGRYVKLA